MDVLDYDLPARNEWLDILNNGEIMKREVRKGNDKRPNAGELVKIVTKRLESGNAEEQESQFVLGYGFSYDMFDIVLPLMSIGEVAHVKSRSRFLDNNPSDEHVYEFEIELLDVQPAGSVDLQTRVNDAREAGNANYNKGKYEKAFCLYEYGITLLNDESPDEAAEELELRKYTLISNAAACLIKLQEWQKVIQLTEDLALSPNVDKLILTKLVLRRCDALIKLKSFEEATESLNACLQIDPSNTLAKSLLGQIQIMNQKEEKRVKSLYKSMFKAVEEDEVEGATNQEQSGAAKSFFTSTRFLLLSASAVGVSAALIHLYRMYSD